MKHGTIGFIHDVRLGDIPGGVIELALVCIADLIAAAAGGLGTPVSRIIRDHSEAHFAARRGGARLLLDGRRVSPVGAAMAGGMTIDSFDAHDGHALTKGHAGAAVLPAALAFADAADEALSGADFIADIVIGYEIAIRAGIATHRTACDYHTSGSWNALGAASIGARRLKLDGETTRHALGTAEFHGPRSQMMRCIDFPTMVKDGSGWGAMAGVSAAYLAQAGFTGAPALVVESEAVADLWADLGARWRLQEMYFKPYPVCRWAQPAVEAAFALMRAHGVGAADIARVKVTSFHEAVRLATRVPTSTEEAQYSLPFPVAAAIVRGRLAAEEVGTAAFADPEIRRLSATMELAEGANFNARFPAERYAQVEFHLRDGRSLVSAETKTRGDPETPLAAGELTAKFRTLVDGVLGPARRARVEATLGGLVRSGSTVGDFLDAVLAAP